MPKIAEESVEAAARTVLSVRASALRPRRTHHIAFDRPFGTVVLDVTGGIPLFAGRRADLPGHREG